MDKKKLDLEELDNISGGAVMHYGGKWEVIDDRTGNVARNKYGKELRFSTESDAKAAAQALGLEGTKVTWRQVSTKRSETKW